MGSTEPLRTVDYVEQHVRVRPVVIFRSNGSLVVTPEHLPVNASEAAAERVRFVSAIKGTLRLTFDEPIFEDYGNVIEFDGPGATDPLTVRSESEVPDGGYSYEVEEIVQVQTVDPTIVVYRH